MTTDERTYDLIVIGSGPAGESGALEAARLHKTGAMIDDRTALGGSSCHTGTLPSKTLRESSLVISFAIDHGLLPPGKAEQPHPVTMEGFTSRANVVIASESAQVRDEMQGHGVAVLQGTASFIDAHTIQLKARGDGGAQPITIRGDHVLIACGGRPRRPHDVPFDGVHVIDSDEILGLKSLPRSLIVLGGGVIGSEYATIFSNLGIPVHLVEDKPHHLPFIDQEIVARLHREMARRPLTLTLGVGVRHIAVAGDEAVVTLADGRELRAEVALYAMGRTSNADRLDLAKAGVTADQHATIAVDPRYRTNVAHIAAAGDVIGFPALAATSWDQGRAAVRGLFGLPGPQPQHLIPYGIYTIPEISTIGMSEEQAAAAGVAAVIGHCEISATARGMISLDHGLLKLVFDRSTRALLGAHCIGARATDIIHIAMMCIRFHGTIADLTEPVFNYPTVSDAIKAAALDALWQLEAGAE